MGTPFFADADEDFGPDFSSTPPVFPASAASVGEPEAIDAGKTTRAKNKPGLFDNLGKNSPARSPIRKLTDADAEKLARYYTTIGKAVEYVHPRLGVAFQENASECAVAWCNLGEKNVKVRAKLLAVLEGGELIALGMAHAPLLIAVLPPRYVEQVLQNVMNGFGQFVRVPDDADIGEYLTPFGPEQS